MKQLYIFKRNAEAAALETGRAFVKSTCDVEKLDRGACDQADKVLATAMGETGCFRDKETGEVIAAWWTEDEFVFDFYLANGETVPCTAVCEEDGNINCRCDDPIEVSEEEMEQIAGLV